MNKQSGKLRKFDLARACRLVRRRGEPDGADGPGGVGFLIYRDEGGPVVESHALRHTYSTRLARSGIALKVIQSLAWHGIVTQTMDHFAHSALCEAITALDGSPQQLSKVGPTAVAATGTDPACTNS